MPRSVAAAPNLVQDGGFEAATQGPFGVGSSFDGGSWTVTQGSFGILNDPNAAHGGNLYAFSIPNGITNGIEQTIGTTAGQSYTLSFFAFSDDTNNTFNVLFDGKTVPGSPSTIPYNGISTDITNYIGYTFDVTAPTNTSTLEFDSSNVSANTHLDDVSLTPNATPAVPEPTPLALLALGLLPVGVVVRRKMAP